MAEQWWLATLDQYGNPTLIDGAHSGRDGCVEALRLHGLIASSDNFLGSPIIDPAKHAATRYAYVRCEIEAVPRG